MIDLSKAPWVHQAWAGLRQIIPPVVAFAIGRHYIPDDVATLILAIAAGIGVPITLGQLKTRQLVQAAQPQE